MKIINVVEDKIMGGLVCFANEKWEPVNWGKYIKYRLFSKEEIIRVNFDLYFYNVDYDIPYMEEEKGKYEKHKEQIWKVYQEFIRNGNVVEDILFEECKEQGIEKYKTKEELNQDVQIVEATIGLYDYSVTVSVPWDELELAIVVSDVLNKKYKSGSVILADEAEPAEMSYKKSEYKLLTDKYKKISLLQEMFVTRKE